MTSNEILITDEDQLLTLVLTGTISPETGKIIGQVLNMAGTVQLILGTRDYSFKHVYLRYRKDHEDFYNVLEICISFHYHRGIINWYDVNCTTFDTDIAGDVSRNILDLKKRYHRGWVEDLPNSLPDSIIDAVGKIASSSVEHVIELRSMSALRNRSILYGPKS